MKKRIAPIMFLMAVSLFLFESVQAQEALKPRPSPMSVATMKFDDAYVKVTYGRPHKKGRELFGKLVPYGEVWRTGANEATEITVTEPILFGGNELDAGTYTLFTVPNEDKWTVILNSQLGQWGAYRYDEKFNVLTFDVPVKKASSTYEPFTIEFDQKTKKTNLNLIWDNTLVSIPVEFL